MNFEMYKGYKESFHKKTESSVFLRFLYNALHEVRVRLEMILPDEIYARFVYKRVVGKRLDLNKPITFDEKLWWIKLHYHDPLMTQCADKYRVRQYIEDCGFGCILNRMFMGGITRAESIDFDLLPDKFYIKTNHGCGGNICVDKSRGYDRKRINRSINRSLKRNYYHQSREWPYKNIEPCVIIEEFLDTGNKPLLDYRFLCFSGRFEYLFVDYDTCDEKGHHKIEAKRNVYSREYEQLPYKVGRDEFNSSIAPKPANYDKMIEIAEALSKPFPFVRVDLYNLDGRIVFGELTFFHAGGFNVIAPPEFERLLGDLIQLPQERV